MSEWIACAPIDGDVMVFINLDNAKSNGSHAISNRFQRLGDQDLAETILAE